MKFAKIFVETIKSARHTLTRKYSRGYNIILLILAIFGFVLFILFAICCIPIIFQINSAGVFQPSITSDMLDMMKNDDFDLKNYEGYYADPQYTHDGSHIFYISTNRPEVKPQGRGFDSSDWVNDIWVMNRNGSEQKRITCVGNIRQFIRDPSSDRIAFNRYENGNNSIFILQDAISKPNRIMGPLPYMYVSSWSPDGNKIAATGFALSDCNGYFETADGEKSPSPASEWSRLFIMNVDGSSSHEIAQVRRGHIDLSTKSSWSPDGKNLVIPSCRSGEYGLGIIEVNTGLIRMLTLSDNQSADNFIHMDDTSPCWNPNGNLVAFIREGDVWVVKPDGNGKQKIYSDGTVEYLSWNPDGTRLAFSADHYLGIVDVDGKNLSRILGVKPGYVSWNPDGRTITYTHQTGSRIRIISLSPGVLAWEENIAKHMENSILGI